MSKSEATGTLTGLTLRSLVPDTIPLASNLELRSLKLEDAPTFWNVLTASREFFLQRQALVGNIQTEEDARTYLARKIAAWRERVIKEAVRIGDHHVDDYLYSLLQSEWSTACEQRQGP